MVLSYGGKEALDVFKYDNAVKHIIIITWENAFIHASHIEIPDSDK